MYIKVCQPHCSNNFFANIYNFVHYKSSTALKLQFSFKSAINTFFRTKDIITNTITIMILILSWPRTTSTSYQNIVNDLFAINSCYFTIQFKLFIGKNGRWTTELWIMSRKWLVFFKVSNNGCKVMPLRCGKFYDSCFIESR